MGFKIVGGPLFSNKPHSPDPYPNSLEYPTKHVLVDGREVWVSCPLPDRLSWIIDITPSVYADWVDPDTSPEAFANSLYDYFVGPKANLQVHPNSKGKFPPKEDPKAKSWGEISFALGDRSSTVWMEHKRQKKGVSVRVEMNPRKLGKLGMAELVHGLGGPASPLKLSAVVATSRLTSADICIDVIGLDVTEVALWHKDQGKRTYWVGEDGRLETIYILRKQKPLTEPPLAWKPKRRSPGLIARIYDRVREREEALKQPPFGQSPITRIEVRKKLNGRTLGDISNIPNPFARMRVGFWHNQVGKNFRAWRRFVAMRRALTIDQCCEYLALGSADRIAFSNAELVPVSNLVSPKDVWKLWSVGLKATGLDLLCK